MQNISRADVEDFLFAEAELLDEWRLPEWLELFTEDAIYYVPSTDVPANCANGSDRPFGALIVPSVTAICAGSQSIRCAASLRSADFRFSLASRRAEPPITIEREW